MNNSRTFYFSLIITNFKFSITHTTQMKPRCEMASKFKIGPANHDTNLKYSEEDSQNRTLVRILSSLELLHGLIVKRDDRVDMADGFIYHESISSFLLSKTVVLRSLLSLTTKKNRNSITNPTPNSKI